MVFSSRSFKSLIWLLLAAALMARAVVPSGWMPVADKDGFRIALCTGTGPAFMTLGRDGRLHEEAPEKPAPRDPCPYALGAVQAASLPPAIELPLPPIAAQALTPAALAEVAMALRRSLRPPARGPPTLA